MMHPLLQSFYLPRPDDGIVHYNLAVPYLRELNKVVTVMKMQPVDQAGRYNFPGGKTKLGETPAAGAARETGEETDVWLPEGTFRPVALLERAGAFKMFVFGVDDPRMAGARTMTNEPVVLLDVPNLLRGDYPMLENIPWLFGLAHDGKSKLAHVIYD